MAVRLGIGQVRKQDVIQEAKLIVQTHYFIAEVIAGRWHQERGEALIVNQGHLAAEHNLLGIIVSAEFWERNVKRNDSGHEYSLAGKWRVKQCD